MGMFSKGLAGALTVAALCCGLTSAHATVVYDSSLISPPGVFMGSGNPNVHWTVDNEAGGVQLGLLGLKRYLGAYVPDAGTSVYHVDTGATTVSGKTGSAWDIAFSVNTGSSLGLTDVTTQFCLQDVGLGTYGCFDALSIPDNAIQTSSTYHVAQNAEALSFPLIAAAFNDPGYNMNADDTYNFTLTLFTGAKQLASVGATLVAGNGASTKVPEPSTLALFGTALLSLGWFGVRRRRRQRA